MQAVIVNKTTPDRVAKVILVIPETQAFPEKRSQYCPVSDSHSEFLISHVLTKLKEFYNLGFSKLLLLMTTIEFPRDSLNFLEKV